MLGSMTGSARPQRAGRWAGAVTSATLAGIGVLHASWAGGRRWPGGTDAGLAALVLSRAERAAMVRRAGRELPPAALAWAVAAGLVAAAGVVGAAAAGHRSVPLRRAAAAVAVTLSVRGAAGIVDAVACGVDERYRRLDLAVYSPLCLALAAGTVQGLRRR